MWIAKLIPTRILSLQARKPTGLIGRYVMIKLFNTANADLNSFVMENLDLSPENRVLEIGFGSGQLINNMAKVTTNGAILGIDFSREMIKQATKLNTRYISCGRVILFGGDCDSLPFADNVFDRLCSTNTLYFWDTPENNFSEMYRVIRSGGRIVLGFRDKEQMQNLKLNEDIFRLYSKQSVIDLLSNAGFTNIQIKDKEGQPFVSYCGVATKA